MTPGDYRLPDHTFRLLCQWGRMYMIGAPRLGYPNKCPSCSEYLSGFREEKPRFDMDDFDRITCIIDNCLKYPHQEALKCRFRHMMPDGTPWKKKHSAAYMGLTVIEYEGLLRSAMRKVDILFSGEEAA